MELKREFRFTSVSGRISPAAPSGLLGPLAILIGTWQGRGFNQIWRPFQGGPPGQDRFLELNETVETLQFDEIPGDIPNRGLLQTDINLHGLRYLQQVQDANVLGPNGELAGIHVEPGIWIVVPPTANPQEPITVARMANIPHGTSLVAQGTASQPSNGTPTIDPVSIAPFGIGTPPPPGNTITPPPFTERNLSVATQFRTDPGDIPNVTQAMVDDPNTALRAALPAVNSFVKLTISTKPLNPPAEGGGTSNIAFLEGAAGGPNARAAQLDAIFWIETFQDANGQIKHQLQYSQTVLLNFNGLSWPHVSVATLVKQ